MGGVIVGWSQGWHPLELPVHLETFKIPLMDVWACPQIYDDFVTQNRTK